MEGSSVEDVLRRSPLFAALDEEASVSLLKSMTEISLARADALFHEGDPGDQLYVVVEGKIKLGRSSGDVRGSVTVRPRTAYVDRDGADTDQAPGAGAQ